MSQNAYVKDLSKIDWLTKFTVFGDFFFVGPVREVLAGLQAKTIPVHYCWWWGSLVCAMVAARWDYFYLWQGTFFEDLYWDFWCFWAYVAVLALNGFYFWGVFQTVLKYQLLKRLKLVFETAKLKNGMGRYPAFVFDRPIDNATRKLRFTKSALPVKDFEQKKSYFESEFQIYIEAVRDNREEGTVDLIYGRSKLPAMVSYSDLGVPSENEFFIGRTRARPISSSLIDIPHYLVAGESGSGKSTFLRQMIATLYMRNQKYSFSLIDLKGGSEFSLFSGLPRIEMTASPKEASRILCEQKSLIERRAQVLAANRCQNIDDFSKLAPKDIKPADSGISLKEMNRHIIFVDEASILFLAGRNQAKDAQQAREAASVIAAQGRAVGIHMIIGVQRPDAQSLDPRTKANLGAILAFRSPNAASSMTMLGNSRAVDLSEVKGRAIWKIGSSMIEVQTPLLKKKELDQLMAPYIEKSEEQKNTKKEISGPQIEDFSSPERL